MIDLRDFRPGDEAALRAVFESAVHEVAIRDYTRAQVDAWAPREHDTQAWAVRMQALRPVVAVVDGVVCGYADLQPDGDIDHFYVAAHAGGRGVGGALMRRILACAAQAPSITQLHAQVSVTAQPFFEHFGFQVVQHQVVEVRGVPLRNALMRRATCEAWRRPISTA